MSLLLDALKRAEQEKAARQGEASNDAAPTQMSAPAPKAASAPSLELQPVASAPPVTPPGGRSDDAHAAQVMFDAKAPRPEEKRGRGVLWATLGAIAVVVGAAGAYVWYQIRVLSPSPVPAVVRRTPPTPLPPAASGAAPPATAPAVAENSNRPATVTVMPEPAARLAAAAPTPPPASSTSREEEAVMRMLREAPAAAAAPPLKLARSLDRPAIPADVSSGYDALRRGDMAEARRRYEKALASDAASLDARLGLATVEAKSGNRMLAVTEYRRVLEMDPRNATALAGLAALADGQPPEAVEAQLREDVARLPESAALRFALGAHYASQRRWGEAQAAFFEAHRLDPTGADILYNLAVSLDHMQQSRLAADFYRRAVEAAQTQTTQFDPASARRRLAEISGS